MPSDYSVAKTKVDGSQKAMGRKRRGNNLLDASPPDPVSPQGLVGSSGDNASGMGFFIVGPILCRLAGAVTFPWSSGRYPQQLRGYFGGRFFVVDSLY